MQGPLIRTFCLMCALATSAQSGAWPREAGTGFASASTRLGSSIEFFGVADPSGYSALYLEYGLPSRLTLGIDAGRSVSGDGKTVVFARWPVRKPGAKWLVSAELGVGRISGLSVLRPGLSLGHGFYNDKRSGWFAVDLLAEHRLSTAKTDTKIDITYGLNRPGGKHLIAQIQIGMPEQDPAFARLALSRVAPMRRGRKIETGL